jgi:hypothetical protein
MKLPLIMDYEVYDEDGPCAPYFTGKITDADGRVICRSENEERAAELVDHVAALLARHNALREAVGWERECQLVRHYIIFEALETCALREITRSISAARAAVDTLLEEK